MVDFVSYTGREGVQLVYTKWWRAFAKRGRLHERVRYFTTKSYCDIFVPGTISVRFSKVFPVCKDAITTIRKKMHVKRKYKQPQDVQASNY